MERTTISLPHEVIVRLRITAAERRTSMAAIIREAIEEKLNNEPLATVATAGKRTPKRPMPKSIGMGASGFTDTSRLAGEMKFEPRS